MDVNETLRQLLEIADRIHNGNEEEYDAGEMADLLDELDHWLSRGGFLPDRWGTMGKRAIADCL